MSRFPKIRFIVQTDKGWMCRIGPENIHTGKLLIQCPGKFIHIDVVDGHGRRSSDREWSIGGRAFIVDYRPEVAQVWEGHRHLNRSCIHRHIALKLEGHETCQTRALVASNKTAHCFRWNAR